MFEKFVNESRKRFHDHRGTVGLVIGFGIASYFTYRGATADAELAFALANRDMEVVRRFLIDNKMLDKFNTYLDTVNS